MIQQTLTFTLVEEMISTLEAGTMKGITFTFTAILATTESSLTEKMEMHHKTSMPLVVQVMITLLVHITSRRNSLSPEMVAFRVNLVVILVMLMTNIPKDSRMTISVPILENPEMM